MKSQLPCKVGDSGIYCISNAMTFSPSQAGFLWDTFSETLKESDKRYVGTRTSGICPVKSANIYKNKTIDAKAGNQDESMFPLLLDSH